MARMIPPSPPPLHGVTGWCSPPTESDAVSMTSASAEAPRSLQAGLSALSDDEIPRLICDEPALIDIVSQDAIQYVHMSERGGTIKVGVKHIESLKPEYQRINVAYQIFDIVLHEGDQFQR